MEWLLGSSPSPSSVEPLPPPVSRLLGSRAVQLGRFPRGRAHTWRCSALYRAPLASRLASAVLPGTAQDRRAFDSAQAAFYRLYVFLVLDDVTLFRNELEYFFKRPTWRLASLARPLAGPTEAGPWGESQEDGEAREAVMAGLVRIMEKAFNRLILLGLPRDAPAVVEDWTALRARPKLPEELPPWVLALPQAPDGTAVPDREGRLPGESERDGDFAVHRVVMFTPHWVFV